MKIPIHCEECDKLMATFDTKQDISCCWAEKPCGAKVCDDCCRACEEEISDGITITYCPFRREVS